MKKVLSILTILILLTISGYSQIIQEGSGSSSNSRAISKSGLRVPIVNNLPLKPDLANYSNNPDSSSGALVYCKCISDTNTAGLYVWKKSQWVKLDSSSKVGLQSAIDVNNVISRTTNIIVNNGNDFVITNDSTFGGNYILYHSDSLGSYVDMFMQPKSGLSYGEVVPWSSGAGIFSATRNNISDPWKYTAFQATGGNGLIQAKNLQIDLSQKQTSAIGWVLTDTTGFGDAEWKPLPSAFSTSSPLDTVLANGNQTLGNDILVTEGDRVVVGSGRAGLSKGSFDNGLGGDKGVSLNCAIGYELNWQAGHLSNYSGGYQPLIIDSKLQVDHSIDLANYQLRIGDLAGNPNIIMGDDGGAYLRLATGNQGPGKVWTSDSNGYGSWTELPPPFDSSSISNRINLKVNISDTLNMLLPYLLSSTASSTYFPLVGGTITGTAGAGYIGLPAQSTRPSSPTGSNLKIYSDSLGRFTWLTNLGYSRTIKSRSLSGNRAYTVYDKDYTLADSADVAALSKVLDSTSTTLTDLLDSTGQPTQRILFAAGNKIRSDSSFVYDSVNNKVLINGTNVSVGNTSIKLWVQGNATVSDTLAEGSLGDSRLLFSGYGQIRDTVNLTYNRATGNVGINQASPPTRLYINGTRSLSAWGSSGAAATFYAGSGTVTDTSTAENGTVSNTTAFNIFTSATLVARNTNVTYSNNVADVYISGTVKAGTNVTFTNTPLSLWVSGNTLIGNAQPYTGSAWLNVSGNKNWSGSTNGMFLIAGSTLTDNVTAANGTVATAYGAAISAPTLATTNTGITYTNAATLNIGGVPAVGSNTPTFTSAWAIRAATGASSFGQVAIGGNALQSTAFLEIRNSKNITPVSGQGVSQYISTNTYTDNVTAASGTFSGNIGGTAFQPPIFAASNASVTYSGAASTLLITGPPTAGANMTFSSTSAPPSAIFVQNGNIQNIASNGVGQYIFGNAVSGNRSAILVNSARTMTNQTTSGVQLFLAGNTMTDSSTAASGTASFGTTASIAQMTIAATNASVTYTQAASLYIANAPAAGSNVTIGSAWSIYTAAGFAGFAGGLNTGSGNSSNFTAYGLASVSNNASSGLQIAGSSSIGNRVNFNGTSTGTLAVGAGYANVAIGSSPITTAASGTHAVLANLVVNPIGTVTSGGATVTATASLFINGAGSGGTTNYPFYVGGSGGSRIDGSLVMNATAPDASAVLDLVSTTKGILIPRMPTSSRTAIASPATGLQVYDNSLNQLFFYNGTSWVGMASSTNAWSTSGNTGTTTSNYIGTADQTASFRVKTNGTERFRFDSATNVMWTGSNTTRYPTGGNWVTTDSAKGFRVSNNLVGDLSAWEEGGMYWSSNVFTISSAAASSGLNRANKSLQLLSRDGSGGSGSAVFNGEGATFTGTGNAGGANTSNWKFTSPLSNSTTGIWKDNIDIYGAMSGGGNSIGLRVSQQSTGTGFQQLMNLGTNSASTGLFTNHTTKLAVDVNGSIAIGANYPITGAAIDVNSTTKVIVPSRMTQTQRDAVPINGVATGTITNGGSGYGTFTTATANFTGGSGSGASAQFSASAGGVINSVTIINYGSGYAVGDVLSATIGSGTGFQYTIATLTNMGGAIAFNTTNGTLDTYNGTNWQGFTTSSAGTLTLKHGNEYVFTGTTTTWTLPAINANLVSSKNGICIKNRGSGAITLNTASGSTLYTTSAVSTITINAGASCMLLPDGTYFNVLYNN